MTSRTSEKELLDRLASLPRDIPPVNDPWDRIEARLGESESYAEPNRAGRGRLLGAVAAVAVAGIAAVLFNWNAEEMSATDTPRFAESLELPAGLAASEAEYLAAFREFTMLGESRPGLAPSTVETIETGWADLVQIETALSDALAQDPTDPFLNKRMLELRARQLGFLRQLAALDQSNRRLTI